MTSTVTSELLIRHARMASETVTTPFTLTSPINPLSSDVVSDVVVVVVVVVVDEDVLDVVVVLVVDDVVVVEEVLLVEDVVVVDVEDVVEVVLVVVVEVVVVVLVVEVVVSSATTCTSKEAEIDLSSTYRMMMGYVPICDVINALASISKY